MKTPEQIAKQAIADFNTEHNVEIYDDEPPLDAFYNAVGFEFGYSSIQTVIERAIEADRAQREPNEDGTLHGAAIIALRERADGDLDHAEAPERAAEWIENNPDKFWDRYAGPMLDEIEGDFK